MSNEIHEECGVVAVSMRRAAGYAVLGLHALQHRGQEAAGIVTTDGERFYHRKAKGEVRDVFSKKKFLAKLKGCLAIGHVRYSTAGGSLKKNAQPFWKRTPYGMVGVAHNGTLTNAKELRSRLEKIGAKFQSSSDSEVILHLIGQSEEPTIERAIAEALRQLEGAFSLVFLTRKSIIAARDPQGFRPLVIGQSKTGAVFASETCALDLLEIPYTGEVSPGEMVIAKGQNLAFLRFATYNRLSQCVFEHVYFSRPDSVVFGRSVEQSRGELGKSLAQECPVPNADLVVPVPDSGMGAALGFAKASGIEFALGLIRNHYIGRTFIKPTGRSNGVTMKLSPVRRLLAGMVVVLVDDSLVRGNTAKKIVRMVREAGAKEVHLRISCPPTVSPCFYGVDTPYSKELVAANMTVEQIRQYIGADSLGYLSLAGLTKAVGGVQDYCYACYTGKYPTNVSHLIQIS